MDRAAIYCRVSSGGQEEGTSLQGQEERCRAYCQRMGYKVARILRDVGSGRRLERPALWRLLDACRRGTVDVVVVWRRDRWGRHGLNNPLMEEALAEFGVRLEATDTGRRSKSSLTTFHDRISDATAELMAARIAEDTAAGRRQRALQGYWPQAPPWGWRRKRDSRALEPDPRVRATVRRLFAMVADGHNVREVAATVGCSHTAVINRIRNPSYKGEAIWTDVPLKVPVLIDATTWAKANAVLDERCRQRGLPPRPPGPAHQNHRPIQERGFRTR